MFSAVFKVIFLSYLFAVWVESLTQTHQKCPKLLERFGAYKQINVYLNLEIK